MILLGDETEMRMNQTKETDRQRERKEKSKTLKTPFVNINDCFCSNFHNKSTIHNVYPQQSSINHTCNESLLFFQSPIFYLTYNLNSRNFKFLFYDDKHSSSSVLIQLLVAICSSQFCVIKAFNLAELFYYHNSQCKNQPITQVPEILINFIMPFLLAAIFTEGF